MNDHEFDFHGRIQVQQNHGLIIPDRNSDFGSRSSSQLFGVQQNLGIWPQQQQPCTMDQAARLSQLQNLDSPPNKPSSAIMSRFESLASAFFASFFSLVKMPKFIKNQLMTSGKYSLQYYLLNAFLTTGLRWLIVTKAHITAPALIVLIIFAVCYIVSYLVSKYILDSNNFFRFLCGLKVQKNK